MRKVIITLMIMGIVGILSAQEAEVEKEITVSKDTTKVEVNVTTKKATITHEVTVVKEDTLKKQIRNEIQVQNQGDTIQIRIREQEKEQDRKATVTHEVTVEKEDSLKLKLENKVRVQNQGDTTQIRTRLEEKAKIKDEDGDGVCDSLKAREKVRERIEKEGGLERREGFEERVSPARDRRGK